MNNDVVYDPLLAVEFANKNKEDVKKSRFVGCFGCLNTYVSKDVHHFLSDGSAICPICGSQSVIPDASMPVTVKNLNDLCSYWKRRR